MRASGPGSARSAPGQRVAAVVPCRDEAATLGRCLASLRAQDPPPVGIVVVDDASTDGSRAVAEEAADLVLDAPGGSIAAARNAGAAAAGEVDVLAFVDADCTVPPGWLAAGLVALEGADVAGGRLEAPPDAPLIAARWAAIETRMGRPEGMVWSGAMLVRATAFADLGGFAEDLATGEDVDLCRRVRARGGRVAVLPAPRAVHHGFPPDVRAFARRERWHAGSPGWWWASSVRARALVLAAVVGAAASAAAGVVAVRRRSARPLLAWGAAAGAGSLAAGALSGAGLRTAPVDGALLALWGVVRATRLPTGLRRSGRLPGAAPGDPVGPRSGAAPSSGRSPSRSWPTCSSTWP